tara:strand:- start:181 stop:306 length:126 start_codon:yes stop_codon:yes gene_type:complete
MVSIAIVSIAELANLAKHAGLLGQVTKSREGTLSALLMVAY